MGESEFERLISAMPRIAEAVKSFDDGVIRDRAFAALIASLGVDSDVSPKHQQSEVEPEASDGPGSTAFTKAPAKKVPAKRVPAKKVPAKKKTPAAIKPDPDLDLSPSGKKSFVDFATEKAPSSKTNQQMVAVYWISEIVEEAVTVPKVVACFKKMGWQTPSNPSNALQVIASTKKWLDTSDMEDIKLTHPGSQFVEHSLPPKTT